MLGRILPPVRVGQLGLPQHSPQPPGLGHERELLLQASHDPIGSAARGRETRGATRSLTGPKPGPRPDSAVFYLVMGFGGGSDGSRCGILFAGGPKMIRGI